MTITVAPSMTTDESTLNANTFPNTTDSREQLYTPDEVFRPTITVERDSLPIAIQHGMELWWDGSTPTKRLDERDGSSKFTRFVNGRIEGKLCEVAFMELLEKYFDLRSQVDWRIYGDYETTDDGDLQHLLDGDGNRYQLGIDVDIKKTKPWNQWLAIRKEIFESIGDRAPIILAKTRIESDLQLDEWTDSSSWDDVEGDEEFRNRLLEFADTEFPLEVEFSGTAYKDEFTDTFEQGDRLYDPDTGRELGPNLKRPNEGLHVDDLHNTVARWNRIVADIVGSNPEDLWRPLPVVDQR